MLKVKLILIKVIICYNKFNSFNFSKKLEVLGTDFKTLCKNLSDIKKAGN